ncbi:hypothetical protein M9458_054760, partial [Cirrhinus mrigala]
QTSWPDDPLKLHFRRGLCHDLQAELTCCDEGKTLDELIDLAVRIDNLMRSRRANKDVAPQQPKPPSTSECEPMQVAHTRLTPEERDRRRQFNLCLYCGQPAHLKASCPSRPMQHTSSTVSHYNNSFQTVKIPVIISFADKQIHTIALIDSGAAGNFMDVDFAKAHDFSLIPCTSPLSVAALDGRPLGHGRVKHTTSDLHLTTGTLHTETIRFFLIKAPSNPVILGLPWLQQHEPMISWTEGQITQWSDKCFALCFPSLKPRVLELASAKVDSPIAENIPPEYHDLAEAFSKTRATQLPPHRSSDCAIELLPGTTPPKGRIFPLSQPETDAMKVYIEEELAKGFIVPSTSPASPGYFFVKKKDGSLRPCIDFRGLNDITVKYCYPLPLVPSALEQLRLARYFTKLDLRNAYNLIRIREREEWKTAFSTTTRHYEYRVMPFGLVNSPSVFQFFMNDVFRDMLGRWVIIYMDDILVYSESLESHIALVRKVLQRLITHRLYAKAKKCEFHQTAISFLGYVISSDGVAMDDSKVQAVLKWPLPTTIKELQRFLGFANFYRRFIRNFSPSNVHDQGVEIDASNTWIRAVLSQRHGNPPKLFPCAFFSHKLSQADKNYDVGNHPILPPSLIVASVQWDIMTELTELQITNPPPADCPPDKIHVPQPLRERVLCLVHSTPSSGHPGVSATLQLLSNKFWWPSIRLDTINYIKSFEVCNTTKSSKQPPAGLLQPLPIPQRPWSHIAIDFITDLPPSEGYTTILTVIDRFSKSCRLIPLSKLPTALETAEILCNFVFRFYGLPDDIVSDRGPQFTLRVWIAFFKCLNVNISLSSGYHPESNGQAERINQEIIRFLRSYCHHNQTDWSKFLFWAEYAL